MLPPPSIKNLVLDTCCFLNLANGLILDSVLSLPDHNFFIGPLVQQEASSHAVLLSKLILDGKLLLIDEHAVSALQFLVLLGKYGLGEGETECLTYAMSTGGIVATDDGAARKAVEIELGKTHLTGSIGLLCACVRTGIVTPEEATTAYAKMVQSGAFLPRVPFVHFLSI
jgi:predicted nucleic acid-binding protein